MKKLLIMLFCCFCLVSCNTSQDDEFFLVDDDLEIEDSFENGNDKSDVSNLFEKGKYELEKNNNPKKAIEIFNEALEMDPNADGIYGDRGRAKVELKDIKGAVEDYTKAIELNKRKFYYLMRAEAYDMLNNKELAENDRQLAEKALED